MALAASMEGSRQAALLLHGMQAKDRLWLLDQLPIEQQEVLSTLLAELAELGIPASPQFVRQAIESVEQPALRGLRHLRVADVQRLAQVMRAEPAAFIAQLLSIQKWPWEDALLTQLPALLRRQVQDERRAGVDEEAVRGRRAQVMMELVEKALLLDGARGHDA